jgi:hypothetical protein
MPVTTSFTGGGRPRGDAIFEILVDDITPAITAAAEFLSPQSMIGFMNDKVDPFITKEIVDRFQNEGDSTVGRWAPLSPSTEQIRMDMGFAPFPINERSGELRRALEHDRNFRTLVDGASMDVPGAYEPESVRNKIKTAQQGSVSNPKFPNSTTPPRPVLGLSDNDMFEIMRMIEHEMELFVRFG